METLIVTFLALLWACSATKETAPKNLRERKLMAATKTMCFDLPDYGFQTVEMSGDRARWAHRSEGVEYGDCAFDDDLPTRADRSMRAFCRQFGGNKGSFATMIAPKFLRSWLLDTGAFPGECTGMRRTADPIFMDSKYYDDSDDDYDYDDVDLVIDDVSIDTDRDISIDTDYTDVSIDTDRNVDNVLCIEVDVDGEPEFHTVVVNNRKYTWMRKKALDRSAGACPGGDEFFEDNDRRVDYCARIADRWHKVETDRFFRGWWRSNVDELVEKHCEDVDDPLDGRPVDYVDTIKMFHDSRGRDRDGDGNSDNVLCMEYVADDGSVRYRTVEVSEERRQWFRSQAYKRGVCRDEDDRDIGNDRQVEICVRIERKWYSVETSDDFEGWWADRAERIRRGPCDNVRSRFESIKMVPY